MAFQAKSAFLIVFNFASIVFFSGIVFGWSALREVLLHEMFYVNKCPEPHTPETRCDEQELALHSAFTFASAAVSLSALPAGSLLDVAGPFVTVIVGGVLNVLSLWGMSMTNDIYHNYPINGHKIDIFPYCMIGMAVSGALVQFCGFSCAFVFPEHKNLLIAMASVLFDGSCLVFPVLKLLYMPFQDNPHTFGFLFGFYTVFAAIVFVLLPLAWYLNREAVEASRQVRASFSESDAGPTTGVAALPIRKQLLTLEFVLIMLFTGLESTHSNIYIGTVNSVNEEIADKRGIQEAKLVLVNTIVSLIIPLGFIAVPAITASTERNGPLGSLQVTLVLAMIFTGMQLIPSLYTQLVTVVIFAAYRAFLFSTIPTYNSHYFGVLKMGRIQGCCFLAGGVMSLSQKYLVAWTVNQMDNNYNYLLCMTLGASGMLLILAIFFQFREKKRSSIRQPLRSGEGSEVSLADGGRGVETNSQQ